MVKQDFEGGSKRVAKREGIVAQEIKSMGIPTKQLLLKSNCEGIFAHFFPLKAIFISPFFFLLSVVSSSEVDILWKQ